MNELPVTDGVLYLTTAYGVLLISAIIGGIIWCVWRTIQTTLALINRKSPEVTPEASPGSAHCGATATELYSPREN